MWFSNHFQENEGKIFKLYECLSPRQAKARAVIEPLITILSDSFSSACLAASFFFKPWGIRNGNEMWKQGGGAPVRNLPHSGLGPGEGGDVKELEERIKSILEATKGEPAFGSF